MYRSLLSKLKVAVEDIADGQTRIEEERVYYVKLSDFDQLSQAVSSEFQEQWQIKIPKNADNLMSGTIRVRCTGEGENKHYTLTAKGNTSQSDRKFESTLPATKDTFDLFACLSTNGMRKRRYNFPVGDYVFEVDVYFKDNGEMAEWCKVDLEIKGQSGPIPAIPLKYEFCVEQHEDNTEEEHSLIRGLYETVFLTKNRPALSEVGL